ncbi:hypothetical protein C1646_768515 [Rhizophagus diaphanus]|nr:hypothetical protein C1646_768515 [Rhizophagus diaphanus] [Rhizophagus sp. MUCL 43196]
MVQSNSIKDIDQNLFKLNKLTYSRLTVFDLGFYGSTSAATNVRRELNRLLFLEIGITEDEFGDLLVYITNNPNKIFDLEEYQEGYYSGLQRRSKSWKLRKYVICHKVIQRYPILQQGPDIDFPLKLIDTIKAKEKFGTLNNKLIVKDTHVWPLLGIRKLDFVFIQRDSTLDPLNVVVVGEIKMRIGEGFSKTQAIMQYHSDNLTNSRKRI